VFTARISRSTRDIFQIQHTRVLQLSFMMKKVISWYLNFWTIRFNFILSRSQYLRFIRSFLIELVEECCTCLILATGCVFSCFVAPVLTFFTIYIYTGQLFLVFCLDALFKSYRETPPAWLKIRRIISCPRMLIL